MDAVVYDMQDVGARYYTFLYTMLYALEDCAEAGKDFIILDRMDPLGDRVEGNVLREEFSSFVGGFPLAMRYGLTIGEFARMAVDRLGLTVKLTVVPVEGWQRAMLFPDTGRCWIPPSMGLPTFEAALLYPGLCLFEGTNLSEGGEPVFRLWRSVRPLRMRRSWHRRCRVKSLRVWHLRRPISCRQRPNLQGRPARACTST